MCFLTGKDGMVPKRGDLIEGKFMILNFCFLQTNELRGVPVYHFS